jgi:hypothetical protein
LKFIVFLLLKEIRRMGTANFADAAWNEGESHSPERCSVFAAWEVGGQFRANHLSINLRSTDEVMSGQAVVHGGPGRQRAIFFGGMKRW